MINTLELQASRAPEVEVTPTELSITTVVEKTEHLPQEQSYLVRWMYEYMEQKDWNIEQLARETGISASAISRVFNDKYRDAEDNRIDLKQFCQRIEAFRKNSEGRDSMLPIPFVPTSIYRKIREIGEEARMMHCVGLIYGDGQIGKTASMIHYANTKNYGLSVPDTLYVRVSASGGLRELIDRIAKCTRVNPKWTTKKKVDRIKKFLGPSKVLMVDEMHLLFEAYSDRITRRCIETLRELHDETECGLLVCGTKAFKDEVKQGEFQRMLRQLTRRGLFELSLPDVAPRADLDAIAKYFELPPAPKGSEAEDTMVLIAADDGLGKYVKFLIRGNHLARKAKQKMQWSHFVKAYNEVAAAGMGL